MFLGLEGIVIKSHGGTDALGFASAIDIAYDMAHYELMRNDPGDAGADPGPRRAGLRKDRTLTRLRSVVRGCGAYLPGRVLTNEELARMVDTSDEWIVQRTGIRERHIAADDETTSVLGIKAARGGACRRRA